MKYLSKIRLPALALLLLATLLFSTTAGAMAMREEEQSPQSEQEVEDLCFSTSKQVKEIIKQQQSCIQNSDCVGMKIACSMGCPIVNKENEAKISETLSKRHMCMCTMEYCEPPKEFGCIEGVCKAILAK